MGRHTWRTHQQLLRTRTVGVNIMSLDLYTQNIPLTQKAKFWSNYVSALKGSQDFRAPEEGRIRPRRAGTQPLTPVLPDAHDRIFTSYSYLPVHTEIYGTYRAD